MRTWLNSGWFVACTCALVALAIALTMLSGCEDCATAVKQFRVIRSDFTNQIREIDGQIAYICPGESVALGWLVENADTASIDNGVGNVQVPAGGPIVVTPKQDTHYTITAIKDKCRSSMSVDVFVVTQDKSLSATATLIQRAPFVWEAKLFQQFYSPNIQATSARMAFPVTQSDWVGNKIDLNGNQHAFQLTRFQGGASLPFATLGPPAFELPGTWQISPSLQTEVSDPPSAASFELKLKCK